MIALCDDLIDKSIQETYFASIPTAAFYSRYLNEATLLLITKVIVLYRDTFALRKLHCELSCIIKYKWLIKMCIQGFDKQRCLPVRRSAHYRFKSRECFIEQC